MRLVSDRISNPFGFAPPCEAFVAGYGPTDADFHVIGNHPGVHGGLESGIPFMERSWSAAFFAALAASGLVGDYDTDRPSLETRHTYFSYLHLCAPDSEPPSDAAYRALEPYFDAELRAITADVLLPVGVQATDHVFSEFTARSVPDRREIAELHAQEVRGSGWLVVPIADPAGWTDGDAMRLVSGLQRLRDSDYGQIADLGRFLPDDEPYFVR